MGDGYGPLQTSPVTIDEIFQHHFKVLDRIFATFGIEGIKRFRDNIDGVPVISLFSGLGSAELMLLNNHVAVTQMCKELGIDPPRLPRHLAWLIKQFKTVHQGCKLFLLLFVFVIKPQQLQLKN